ncbi:DUF6098 family protein [Actinacidiphila glaucinigra]|uniref:DUF6098 family protein n=1 Tax=Actinacidiphila glaucinigra TaxID=235986 RepID=UPI0037CA7A06
MAVLVREGRRALRPLVTGAARRSGADSLTGVTQHDIGPEFRPWILRVGSGGAGPENELLTADVHPLAWVAAVIIPRGTEVARRRDTLRRAAPPLPAREEP